MAVVSCQGSGRNFYLHGLSNNIEGEHILWPDSNLEGVQAEYENFSIQIREETGARKTVHCVGYIGFQMLGFWDEMIVENSKSSAAHPFVIDCEQKVKSLPETGAKVECLVATYSWKSPSIDSCRLWVCAHCFHCDCYPVR